MMRAPTPSEPKSTFPTYQVPQESAMRGSAPPVVQEEEKTNNDEEKHKRDVELVDWATWEYRAELPSQPKNHHSTTATNVNAADTATHDDKGLKKEIDAEELSLLLLPSVDGEEDVEISGRSSYVVSSVINGSSCILLNKKCNNGNSNIRMQSVTENCLLNSVTVPKIQRNDQYLMVAHNNYNNNNIRNNYNNNNSSDKLVYKFGALPLFNGRDIPYKKSDDLKNVVLDLNNALINNNLNIIMMQKKMENLTFNNNINNNLITNDDDTISDNNYNENYVENEMFEKTTATVTTMFGGTLEERTIGDDTTITSYSPLRLRGGGESSLSTGTSGWGTPPSQQASNNNANNSSGWGSANPANPNNTGTQQWNNANRQPTNNQGPTSQDANKTNANGQPATSQSNNSGWGQPSGAKPPTAGNNVPPTSTATVPPPANTQNNNNNNNVPNATPNTTKQQLEQLNNMREAIFSQDGWGGQHVNQDTNWDIPGSPEPPLKMDGSGGGGGPPPWKPTVNNGTELWEANLRNGGQPPPQPQQKTPWGHTPSTNIGGTWGEDDDTDSSNVWTGVPSGQQQWGSNAGNNGAAMWGGAKKENDWGAGGGNAGWGDPRAADPRSTGMDPREIRPDLRDMRSNNTDPMRMIDPREQMRQMANSGDMRGDPRGITGRLNGAGAEAFWGQAAGPHAGAQHMHHQNKMGVGGPGNSAGWEEPSPPSQRRNMPNYDDGTSLWGNPQQGSHWKDLPTGAGGMGGGGGRAGNGGGSGPPGMPQSRMKPDGSGATSGGVGSGAGAGGGGGVWAHGRNGSWDEVGPGGGGNAPNAGVSAAGAGAGWADESGPWQKQKINTGAPLWDNELDWGGPKPGPKQPLTKEMVWNSKQFRMLVDMGHKKEDVENALRMRDMNLDAALDLLSPMQNPDGGWRTAAAAAAAAANRHEDHYDHGQFPSQRFASGPTGGGGQMSFQPGNNPPNLLNNMNASGTGANGSLINNISPAVVQKLLTQGGGSGFSAAAAAAAAASSAAAAAVAGRSMQPQTQQPSTQQLRMLVQQIQMAVQAGYLNHQILNQPLAPQTLVLLNQLLQQIKTLQQLGNQQITQTKIMNGQPPNAAFLQCSVLITKTKQTITNLQNQIAAQQAIYVKQQQHQGMGGTSDLFKQTQMHDSLNALQNNFAELAMNKDPQVVTQQSRLTQWINNKDKEDGSEFSRAPGSVSKPLATSPNMNPLGLTQPDGPWSSGRTGDTGWPDSGAGDAANDMKEAQWSTPTQPSLTDLVPEFEPGKPWKGNQLKSIEDDPSITPGSVVRSPLSIPTLKDNNELLYPSKSPPVTDTMSLNTLSSSTWSFNPPASTTSAFTSPQSKLPTSKGLVGDLNPTTAVTSELWGAPKRGPPPGLSAKGGAGAGGGNSLVNGWSSNLSTPSWGGQRSSGSWSGSSPWLLLRNLTAQIDGSTLRTLCMQHGPLQSFHLYLHQGFALAKYSTQQEATKAQTALNNCVLGNTTILAENPTDWDATALLQQVASQPNSSGAWRGSTKQPGTGTDTWSTGWPNPTTASLWATSTLDTGDQSRATPSSLNSFLPNDLLGGESM